jgi:TetR/AcrR family transcriptional regulator, regulator of cefoperazone and chloramphenicol sensitivity
MNAQDPRESTRGVGTREALVAAAIDVFGRDGFHAASTRSIAEAAGVNQALIGYHFGGKEGLYLAALEHIAAAFRERVGTIAAAIQADLDQPSRRPRARDQGTGHDLALLTRLLDAQVVALTGPESAGWARLILREQQAPTRGFEVLYEGYMSQLLDIVGQLVTRIVGRDLGREELAVLVFTIVGQALVFRVARAAVLHQTGWRDVGPAEIAAIQTRIHRNVSALLEEAGKP